MAKSSKKQCRKPRPPKQGGGLVVVSARDMRKVQGNKRTESVMDRGKGKMKTSKGVTARSNGLGTAEISEGPHPSKGCTTSGSKRGFLFISTTERPERLYYLLHVQPLPSVPKEARPSLRREEGCHALVFVATVHAVQELLAQLKALSVSAFAIHERTPKAQAEDYMRRVFSENSQDRAAVLLMTNGAVGRPNSLGGVREARTRTLKVVHFDAASNAKIRAARERAANFVREGRDPGLVDEIFLEDDHMERLEAFPFNGSVMDVIRSRLAVARKLVRAQATSCSGGQDKDMKRRASSAGLDWDDDRPEEFGADAAMTSERRRGLAQQAAALKEKLRVLLCQPLLPRAPPPTGGEGKPSIPDPKQRTSSKETRKKMTVLGMIPTVPEAQPDERCRAQSRWLDEALGRKFGGDWEGSVRVGASCDSASRALRSLVETAKQAEACQTESARSKGSKRRMVTAMRRWNPKPDTPDDDRWGGKWGKPCGHNEVVLQHLRPFAPIEVVNTRVCSKASPAPGNSGFEGCLEHLSLSCWAHRRALTVWDDAAFHFIDPSGNSSTLEKQDMLQLPLPILRFVVKNMKSFTLCCAGQRSPRELARSVLYCTGWAAKQSCFAPLDKALSARVMSFVLSGDRATWRSVSISRVADGVSSQAYVASTSTADAAGNVRLIFADKKRRFNL